MAKFLKKEGDGEVGVLNICPKDKGKKKSTFITIWYLTQLPIFALSDGILRNKYLILSAASPAVHLFIFYLHMQHKPFS